ncbi:MAG: hypothetical protein IJ359_05075 [Erysipelotrichaceae bacterium]|nr:hypothetical protein [Erysipelotrichaceae bacterium]
MVEIEVLHNNCILGITMYLPKTKIVLLYHTNAVVVSDPFLMESSTFDRVNVLYTNVNSSVEAMLYGEVKQYRLVQDEDIWVGMKVVDALEILQK